MYYDGLGGGLGVGGLVGGEEVVGALVEGLLVDGAAVDAFVAIGARVDGATVVGDAVVFCGIGFHPPVGFGVSGTAVTGALFATLASNAN